MRFTALLFVVLNLAWAIQAGESKIPLNLVENGSFEKVSGNQPVGWRVDTGYVVKTAVMFVVDRTAASEGKQSLCLWNFANAKPARKNGDGLFALLSSPFKVDPTREYILSGKAKGKGLHPDFIGGLRLDLLSAEGTHAGYREIWLTPLKLTEEWRAFFIIIGPADFREITARARVHWTKGQVSVGVSANDKATTGALWVDDVFFGPKD